MRNIAKANTLKRMFPLLSVEQNCIISKQADITFCYKVELPEIFSLSSQDYQAIHSLWEKALKVLPDFTIVHKQDWFTNHSYSCLDDLQQMSYLSQSFEKHFMGRGFLKHECYLYITKTNKQRIQSRSNFSSLVYGELVPKQIKDKTVLQNFEQACLQFERILNDSEYFSIQKLCSNQIVGTTSQGGLLQRYMSLNEQDNAVLEDIELNAQRVRVGENVINFFTFSNPFDLPLEVSMARAYDKLSSDKSELLVSFASHVSLQLDCNHIYNQYLFIEDSDDNLKMFEKRAKNMHSLSRYSRSNQINKQWIEQYLNQAHSQGLQSIRAHFNVMTWSDCPQELKQIKNKVTSSIASMGCIPRHNTVDSAVLFWAGIPGNSSDFPSEESFYSFVAPAICFFNSETNSKDSQSDFGIKMTDRLSGRPVFIDLSDLPMKKGIITNRNKFILGPSGSGKSFFTNHLLRQYHEQGAHVLIVDTGNSYKGLCDLIGGKSNNQDGIYFTYTQENPISFNPFYTQDGIFDIEKKESIKTLILTLWKRDDQPATRSEEVAISNAVNGYLKTLEDKSNIPSFNGFYQYLNTDYKSELDFKKVREKDFDLHNLLNVLEPYYKGGEYDYLLNSNKELDLLSKRFIVFEIDSIKGAPVKVA
ncbi:TraG family conjugative transposon ATPase [Myroides sp. BIT-d1]|uniref:TraG family conjugative transposon ATPase n=1 Tax=Myroides albus TaxID=2562892 RepID=A0A6I3LK81_9FLAO|nr:TraG family conjugative transposon ATPase [Myroides albus]